eukprot:m.51286 g.51286  ORF g.51286 m.51286 type:complete len:923 (-) comp21424_c0_seq1:555-3323(-)
MMEQTRSPLRPLQQKGGQQASHSRVPPKVSKKPIKNPRNTSASAGDIATCTDLTKLTHLNENTVLLALEEQFVVNQQPYVNAGIALLALNPFTVVPGFYDVATQQKYHTTEVIADLPPHIYSNVEQAYRAVTERGHARSQTIVVSGESGAGKTFSTKTMLDYLANVCNDGTSTFETIAKTMQTASVVLDAFGNARTTLNENSSRFSKFIKIHFDSEAQKISGAEIQTYLLERSRITNKPTEEENFHILQQIFELDGKKLAEIQLLESQETFKYLGKPKEQGTSSRGISATISALRDIGIENDQLDALTKTLSGILHLGNITAPGFEGESQTNSLATAAQLFQVQPEALSSTLFLRTLKIRGEMMRTKLSRRECHSNRNTLAKTIYVAMFDWIVDVLNRSSNSKPTQDQELFIGFLDIFGFESVSNNSLEQLCINYANEKLQQLFCDECLKSEQKIYIAEGLDCSNVKIIDNSKCVELIDGKCNIFGLLNEECALSRRRQSAAIPSGGESGAVVDILASRLQNHAYFVRERSQKSEFGIVHFAGTVIYDTSEFVQKNRERTMDEHVKLLQESSSSFIVALVSKPQKRQQSVVSKFKQSLSKLFGVLRETQPLFTRCIKPNDAQQPQKFDKAKVLSQLKACGVIETVKISSAGLPHRFTYSDMNTRFRGILNESTVKNSIQSVLGIDSQGILYGKTQIFMSEHHWNRLEQVRNKKRKLAATKVQVWYRSILLKREERKKLLKSLADLRQKRKSVKIIQKKWRLYYHRKQQAAVVIQRKWREYCSNKHSVGIPRVSMSGRGINWMGASLIPQAFIHVEPKTIQKPQEPQESEVELAAETSPLFKTSNNVLSYFNVHQGPVFHARPNPIPNSDAVPRSLWTFPGLLQLLETSDTEDLVPQRKRAPAWQQQRLSKEFNSNFGWNPKW